MTRLFALAAGLTLLGPATAAAQTDGPLVLADGSRYDPTQTYKATSRSSRLISVAGYDFRSAPGPDAPPRAGALARFRTTAFLQYAVPWQSKRVVGAGGAERTYHLMALIDDDMVVSVVLGWLPDHLLLPVNGLTPAAMTLRVTDGGRQIPTRVPRRGMVVNTLETVQAWQQQQRQNPKAAVLFELPQGGLAAELKAGTCPPALLAAFKDNGLVVGKDAMVTPRPDVKGWRLTFRDGPTGGVQQYLATEENGQLAVKESANMAWVYGRPTSDGGADARTYRRKSFAVSNVFFVYQELDAALNPVEPGGPRPAKSYCLVGSSADTPDAQAPQAIHGWIETSRLSEWPTTMALEWDRPSTLPPGDPGVVGGVRWDAKLPAPPPLPRRAPDGLLFHSREGAVGWMRALHVWAQSRAPEDREAVDRFRKAAGPKDPAPVTELAEAQDKAVSRRLGGLEMRFPVLRTAGEHADTQKMLYELGWFGPIKSVGGPDVSDADRAAARKKLLDAQRAAKTVDLLFVIDGTGSMTGPRNEVVPDVLATCLTQLDEFRRGTAGKGGAGVNNPFRDLTVRARVVLFGRDKGQLVVESSAASNGQVGAANPAEVVSAALGDAAVPGRIRAFADWVKGKNLPADGNAAEEPVYDALLEALKTDASSDSTKFLVLMADMPDVSALAGVRVEREKARRVVRSLVGIETDAVTGKESFTAQPRNFIAVQLPPVGGWASAAAEQLSTQLKRIETELTTATITAPNGEKVSAGVEAAVEAAREADPAKLNARIRDIWKASFDRVRERLDRLDRDTGGAETGEVRPDGVDPASFRHWLAQGINLDALASDGVQVYQPVFGYARMPTPAAGRAGIQDRTQLRTVFLVQRQRAVDLRNATKSLVDGLNAIGDDPAKAKAAIQNIVAQLLKDDQARFSTPLVEPGGRSLSLTELFKLLAGIEFPPESVLDLDRLLEANKTLPPQSRVQLLLAYERLNELLEHGTEGDYRVFNAPLPGGVGTEIRVERIGRPQDRRPADRAFTFPGFPDNPYLWLDQEYHLP